MATFLGSCFRIGVPAAGPGDQCSKHNFWLAIKNPVYCGKIFVHKYKDEVTRVVAGKHEGIISEDLFYKVQDVLDGRGKTSRPIFSPSTNFRYGVSLSAPRAAEC
jgi:hypothetical protein